MGFVFLLTGGTNAIEIKLLTNQTILGFCLNLIVKFRSVQIKHVINATAFNAPDVGVFGNVGVVTEAVFTGVENLNQADFMQNINRLV